MRNPIIKDTLREIKKTKGRFLSIMGIVMIGVAFFSGVWATAPDMKYTADKYFDDYNLMDYRVLSNFGLTDEDLAELTSIKGVKGVYGAYTQDVLMSHQSQSYVTKVSTYNQTSLNEQSDDYINRFVLVEGRYPEKSNEILVEKGILTDEGLKLGDQVTFQTGTKDSINDYYTQTNYEIVGFIHSPYYLSYDKGVSVIGSGSVALYAYISEENVVSDYYTEAFVTVEQAEMLNSYETAYFDMLKPITLELERLGSNRSVLRSEEIKAEANLKLAEAELEYEDGRKKFDEEIAQAKLDLETGKHELILAKANIDSNETLLASQLAAGRQQISTLKSTVKGLETQYEEYKKQFEEANAQAISQRKVLVQTKTEKEIQVRDKKVIAQSLYDNLADIELKLTAANVEIKSLTENKSSKEQQIVEIDAKLALLDPTTVEFSELTLQKATIVSELLVIDQSLGAKNAEIVTLNERKTVINNDPAIIEINNLESEISQLDVQINFIDQTLSSGSSALVTMKTQIDGANAQITAAETELVQQEVNANAQLANGKAEIAKAERDLKDGEATLVKEELTGQAKLDDALDEITKAKNEISLIDDAKWFVLDRNSHYSYVDFKGAAERMENIAVVFPVFFFLVAALVCLTTMTRFVDEQRLQIGTLKALGYTAKTIAFKYIFYAASASFIGGALGLLLGMTVFPWIIYNAWMLMYIMPQVQFVAQWGLVVITLAISIVVTTGATLVACYKELVASPSLLMRQKAPKVGKKIMIERFGFIWNNLSFTLKVTFRNIFRYKKRMMMTIIGIAGCTALLVAGFGIKDSISDIARIQYEEVIKYDGTLNYETDLDNLQKEEIQTKLQSLDHVSGVLEVSISNAEISFDSVKKDISLVITDQPADFKDFYSLRSRKTKVESFVSNQGVIITEKIANDYNINAGDFITITTTDNITKSLKIDAVVENYVNHYIYMSASYYRESFGVKANMNSLLFSVDDEQYEAGIAETMLKNDTVQSVNYYRSFLQTFLDMVESLNIIVVVLVISAGALAFIVLYNLTNVNISERQREIATLKVLGFYPKEIRRYVYYENIILTILGSLVGLGIGIGLHLLVMVVVEMEDIMFGRNIQMLSFVFSLGLTILFAMLVNKAMQSKLRKIEMVESLKSIE